ncbi:B24 [miniopterid betaherpesvirus 1]|uniref:B24 n=1 Tax=miniopterid betaherpesvirus 1 TaxID=3070189 RepID=I3VPZ2_9BETA|nr:B24 [miniopterid betaherpesvirus 1]AFK83836.1 B24 [miniopterid betaherpesvirus 1]
MLADGAGIRRSDENPLSATASVAHLATGLAAEFASCCRVHRGGRRGGRAGELLRKLSVEVDDAVTLMDDIRRLAELTSEELSAGDMSGLRDSAKRGVEWLDAYVRGFCGTVVKIAWPPGWGLVLGNVETDPDVNAGDLARLGSEFTCCELDLFLVGRVCAVRGPEPGRSGGPMILASRAGPVFCYWGWRDDAIYCLGRDMEEFSRLGLRRVERVYDHSTVAPPLVVKDHWNLIRAWETEGLDGLAKYVIRLHGKRLRMPCSVSTVLRVCSLGCCRRGRSRAPPTGLAVRDIGERVVPIGTVRRGSRVDGPPVPVLVAEKGRVFAWDARSRQYIRLADGLVAFAGLGMRNYDESYRYTRGIGDRRYDRIPGCPLSEDGNVCRTCAEHPRGSEKGERVRGTRPTRAGRARGVSRRPSRGCEIVRDRHRSAGRDNVRR